MAARRLSLVLLVVFSLGVLLCPGCAKAPDPWQGTTKTKVLTTFAPVYCLTAQIAEPDADVLCLLGNQGVHDYQPSPHEVRLLATADLFISVGHGLEDFLDDTIRNANNPRLRIVKAGEAIPENLLEKTPGYTHLLPNGKECKHEPGVDPHLWLGIPQAEIMTKRIRDALCERDPDHAENYKKRTELVLAELGKLRQEGQSLKAKGAIVTFHDSFRYFARKDSFNLEIAGYIKGVKGQDISGGELQKQAKEFREKNVRIIGIEPQYMQFRGAADQLAKAIGPEKVRIVELDPIETAPLLAGQTFKLEKDWYFKRMRDNLENLRQAFAE
jgi:zinc/manganese transport system substrate-binding protein